MFCSFWPLTAAARAKLPAATINIVISSMKKTGFDASALAVQGKFCHSFSKLIALEQMAAITCRLSVAFI